MQYILMDVHLVGGLPESVPQGLHEVVPPWCEWLGQ